MCPVPQSAAVVKIKDLKRRTPALAENESASLLDMGDGVLLLEFHSKMNVMDAGIFEIVAERAGTVCTATPPVW